MRKNADENRSRASLHADDGRGDDPIEKSFEGGGKRKTKKKRGKNGEKTSTRRRTLYGVKPIYSSVSELTGRLYRNGRKRKRINKMISRRVCILCRGAVTGRTEMDTSKTARNALSPPPLERDRKHCEGFD